MKTTHHVDVRLRPIEESDIDFLKGLYATTRYDIDRAPISDLEKETLKAQQFEAQHKYYQQTFSDANFDLICDGSKPIGRIYVQTTDDEVRLIDICFLPEQRGRGIGSSLIQKWQQYAARHDVPLRLRVESDNRALGLYRRLGFEVIADEEINLHMEWSADNGQGVE